MPYRGFTVSGKVLDVVFKSDGYFSTPAESQIADLALALGVSPGVIEAFESDSDPSSKAEISLPPAPPAPPTEREQALAALKSASTVTDLKAALEVLLAG